MKVESIVTLIFGTWMFLIGMVSGYELACKHHHYKQIQTYNNPNV